MALKNDFLQVKSVRDEAFRKTGERTERQQQNSSL
tara:strand:+ start:303 stop:407 length:105 start_codon:yes stop_codon:yes gene_type:complete